MVFKLEFEERRGEEREEHGAEGVVVKQIDR